MKTSDEGIKFIKQFEGCQLDAYKCPAGVWTIGYGHTGDVRKGQKITAAQAEAYLRVDLEKSERKVEKYDKQYVWTQNQFDALVSFTYNIGNIDQLTAKGTRTKDDIADAMLLYNKARGKVLDGLTRRRMAERQLFVTCGSGLARDNAKNQIKEFSLKEDGEKQISKNFKVKEFRCKDGADKVLVDVDFVVDKLQTIRSHFNSPMTINSAYRTPGYNKKVGGAPASYHMLGQAFDVAVKGHEPSEVARYAQSLGIRGIILYREKGFVHLDSRTNRYWAKDDNGRQTVVGGF